MSRGENIFKRKDGRWEARYVKGRDCSGKILYGFCYAKTYRDAKEKVTRLKAAVAVTKPAAHSGSCQNFGFYCDEWLQHTKTKVKESTYVKYATILELHIKPKLGAQNPLQLTAERIDDFSQKLLVEEGLSTKTVHDILMILHSILKYIAGLFPAVFPAIDVHYPKVEKKEMRVLSREEQDRLVAYLQEDMNTCKFGFLLALFTGMRIGELCALRWGNISVKDRTIRITSTLQRLQNLDAAQGSKTKIVIGPPKSQTAARVIPMTDSVADLCGKMEVPDPDAFVLTGTQKYMEPRMLQYLLKSFTEACGLEGVHCHTLRHTFATRAVEAGFEIKSLSEVLGHATTTITLERYVHSSMALKRENMEKLSTVGF